MPSLSTHINAPAMHVWQLVSDVTRMEEWSPETRSAEWLDGAQGPTVDARFKGRNKRRGSWSTTCCVTAADPGREFAFTVGRDETRWRYMCVDEGDGCELTESFEIVQAPGAVGRAQDVVDRLAGVIRCECSERGARDVREGPEATCRGEGEPVAQQAREEQVEVDAERSQRLADRLQREQRLDDVEGDDGRAADRHHRAARTLAFIVAHLLRARRRDAGDGVSRRGDPAQRGEDLLQWRVVPQGRAGVEVPEAPFGVDDRHAGGLAKGAGEPSLPRAPGCPQVPPPGGGLEEAVPADVVETERPVEVAVGVHEEREGDPAFHELAGLVVGACGDADDAAAERFDAHRVLDGGSEAHLDPLPLGVPDGDVIEQA